MHTASEVASKFLNKPYGTLDALTQKVARHVAERQRGRVRDADGRCSGIAGAKRAGGEVGRTGTCIDGDGACASVDVP